MIRSKRAYRRTLKRPRDMRGTYSWAQLDRKFAATFWFLLQGGRP